jgi:hypothetical protein
MGHRSRARFLPFSLVLAWAGPGATAAVRFLPCFADEWTPYVRRALLPLVVTEPETNTTATESIEETGISILNRHVWSYKRVAACSLIPFSI